MMQNSLGRLFDGMAASLRDVVLPHVDDGYARSQLAACVELLGNIATRVEWSRSQLEAVAAAAEAAVAAAAAASPELGTALVDSAREQATGTGDDGPLARRDRALASVGDAMRWCDRHAASDDVRRPLEVFAKWHLDAELALLRTGMYSK